MNDRLKFRCWDDIHREMLDLREQDVNPYNISDIPQNNIMQCTGLKDKNGKLIYENDIVKRNGDLLIVRYQEEMSCLAPQHFYLENDKIIYCGREWFEEYTSKDYELYVANCYEVIGNIYMDSHLLDKSNNL